MVWASKDATVGSFTAQETKAAFEGAFENGTTFLHRCDTFGLRMQPLTDVALQLRHSYRETDTALEKMHRDVDCWATRPNQERLPSRLLLNGDLGAFFWT